MDRRPIVIVGTGLGGYSLARELRKLDAETPVPILTAGRALLLEAHPVERLHQRQDPGPRSPWPMPTPWRRSSRPRSGANDLMHGGIAVSVMEPAVRGFAVGWAADMAPT